MSGLAAGALAIGLLGQTLHAQPLRSDIGPCEARDQTVREWRAVGRPVYLHQVSGWCVVSALDGQFLLSQQWRAARSGIGNSASEGWEVRLPLDLLMRYHESAELMVGGPGYPGDIRVSRIVSRDLNEAHRIGERRHGLTPRQRRQSDDHPALISSQVIKGETRTVISLKTGIDEIFQIRFSERKP
jgi:hypothetical protein